MPRTRTGKAWHALTVRESGIEYGIVTYAGSPESSPDRIRLNSGCDKSVRDQRRSRTLRETMTEALRRLPKSTLPDRNV